MTRALLALALASCAPASGATVAAAISEVEIRRLGVDLTIHGDTRFTPHERMLFELAARAWRVFSGGRIRLAFAWDYDAEHFLELAGELHVVRTSPARMTSLEAREAREGRVGNVCAYFNPETRELGFAAGDLGRCPELYPVILHELGHVVNVADVPEPGNVMTHSQPGGPGWAFKARDRDACVAAGLCEVP